MSENQTQKPDAKDAQDNKIFAILAYFGILFLVPLLAAKDSPFARYHANQGIVLFLVSIACGIVAFILSVIFAMIHLVFLGSLVYFLLYIGLFVLAIIGIVNAAKGETKELPLIGKFQILK